MDCNFSYNLLDNNTANIFNLATKSLHTIIAWCDIFRFSSLLFAAFLAAP